MTTHEQAPAILFGLENIVEEGWSHLNSIEGNILYLPTVFVTIGLWTKFDK